MTQGVTAVGVTACALMYLALAAVTGLMLRCARKGLPAPAPEEVGRMAEPSKAREVVYQVQMITEQGTVVRFQSAARRDVLGRKHCPWKIMGKKVDNVMLGIARDAPFAERALAEVERIAAGQGVLR